MKEKLHKVNSVTKIVFSILVGIEIDRGELGVISESIEDFFPDLKDWQSEITVENLRWSHPL